MSLTRIDVDPALREHATSARRDEWETLGRAVCDPDTLVIRDDIARLALSVSEQSFAVEAFDTAERSLELLVIPVDELIDEIHEYVDIVRQMSDGPEGGMGLARLEALDMAKKVVHDRAGRRVKKRFRPLRADLETSRRLFSYLLALKIDTTRLVGIHGHRTIR